MTSRLRAPQSKQRPLFGADSVRDVTHAPGCHIVDVGRRRDGGTRYWCLRHKSDATAKYGKRAEACRTAHLPPITEQETLSLDLEDYAGGVALWGAVPPVYDTSVQPLDRGIHVHARRAPEGVKEVDRTYRAVRVRGRGAPDEGILVTELDAIYYMVSSVFGYEMRQVICTYCEYPHLDRDWFSVHPHRSHLCAGCGRHFRDTATSVGNPICGLRTALSMRPQISKPSRKKLNIRQEDYPGGLQIWGSNPAFIWTSRRSEEEGIHVHGFEGDGPDPELDDTFGDVTIDGIRLDAVMVRTLMAQSALPHIAGRVMPISCPSCDVPQFSIGDLAFTPTVDRRCENCDHQFAARGRLRKIIANPLPAILERLARFAPRAVRTHVLDLLPETL